MLVHIFSYIVSKSNLLLTCSFMNDGLSFA